MKKQVALLISALFLTNVCFAENSANSGAGSIDPITVSGTSAVTADQAPADDVPPGQDVDPLTANNSDADKNAAADQSTAKPTMGKLNNQSGAASTGQTNNQAGTDSSSDNGFDIAGDPAGSSVNGSASDKSTQNDNTAANKSDNTTTDASSDKSNNTTTDGDASSNNTANDGSSAMSDNTSKDASSDGSSGMSDDTSTDTSSNKSDNATTNNSADNTAGENSSDKTDAASPDASSDQTDNASADASSDQPIKLPATISLTTNSKITAQTQQQSDPKFAYTVNVNFPQVTGKNLSPAAIKFNQAINKVVSKTISDFIMYVKFDYPHMMTLPESLHHNSFNMTYDVNVIKPGRTTLISVRFTTETQQAGRPHPYQRHVVMNYNFTESKELKLTDLFKSRGNYLAVFSKVAREKLSGKLQDKVMLNQGSAPVAKNYLLWNVEGDGVLITFDAYQVAPYSDGAQEVRVPYGALKKVLAGNAVVLGCVVKPGSCVVVN